MKTLKKIILEELDDVCGQTWTWTLPHNCDLERVKTWMIKGDELVRKKGPQHALAQRRDFNLYTEHYKKLQKRTLNLPLTDNNTFDNVSIFNMS